MFHLQLCKKAVTNDNKAENFRSNRYSRKHFWHSSSPLRGRDALDTGKNPVEHPRRSGWGGGVASERLRRARTRSPPPPRPSSNTHYTLPLSGRPAPPPRPAHWDGIG
ncbi:Protein of unknown function [Gryllus bimaculatus]|nr:Protein of unknown function [Gryllus bimaculatus]